MFSAGIFNYCSVCSLSIKFNIHNSYLKLNLFNSLETVDHSSCMDLQKIKCGLLMTTLLLCLQMIPVGNPLLTCFSNHLKKI